MPARLFFENQYLAKTRLLRVRYLHFRWLATFTFLCYVPEKKGRRPAATSQCPPFSCTSEIAAHLRIYTHSYVQATQCRAYKKTRIVFPPLPKGRQFQILERESNNTTFRAFAVPDKFFSPRLHKNMAVGEEGEKGCQFGPVLCLSWRRWRWYGRRCVCTCMLGG